MAHTLVQHRSVEGTGASSVSLAFLSNLAAGNAVIVGASGFADTLGTGSMSDGHNTYTRDSTASNTNARAAIYSAPNVAAGATTVVLNTGIGADKSIAIHEYSGLVTASMLDQQTSNTATSGTHSSGTTAATTNANDLIFLVDTHEGVTGAVTAGSGYVVEESQTSNTHMPIATEDKAVSATGTQTGSFTWVNAAYACCIAAYQDAGGGGGSTFPLPEGMPQEQMQSAIYRM